MKIKISNWKVSTLVKKKFSINSQPEYQRGEVWSSEKEALLIDSILRGIDIPKIYLREIPNRLHDYEVADGQQRLNALSKFKDNELKLLKKTVKGLKIGEIDGVNIGGFKFSELPQSLQNKFLNTDLTISIIQECTEDEVRTLFGRLQEGVTLNPAEKRNAILSDTGKHIESFVLNHKFFQDCKISRKRFKHHDYMAHVVGLIAYNNSEDLKSKLLEKLYLDKSFKMDHAILSKIDNVLDNMNSIDNYGGKRIKNKYSFIDIFWLLYTSHPQTNVNISEFKKAFDEFDSERVKYRQDLPQLIKIKTARAKNLHKYILAYDRSGAVTTNIETRREVFNKEFSKFIS